MTCNNFLELTNNERLVPSFSSNMAIDFSPRPRVVCNDGFSISIQANECAYCLPRISQVKIDDDKNTFYFKGTNDENGEPYTLIHGYMHGFRPYTHVEIGYLNPEEHLNFEWAGDEPKDVYGYVPVSDVDYILRVHGGINIKETFKRRDY